MPNCHEIFLFLGLHAPSLGSDIHLWARVRRTMWIWRDEAHSVMWCRKLQDKRCSARWADEETVETEDCNKLIELADVCCKGQYSGRYTLVNNLCLYGVSRTYNIVSFFISLDLDLVALLCGRLPRSDMYLLHFMIISWNN